jgi:hypothetical protein
MTGGTQSPDLEKVPVTEHIENEDDFYTHPGTSVRAQLDTWHANRGSRSIVSAMVPRPHTSADASKNPLKFLGEISLMNWALFFSGWLCWTCDG